jgi:hydroxymethylpyrimidine/phosphomethylpyrimidine kinase
VVDPVLGATSGGALIEEGVVDALRAYLLPRALVVTPNSGEAATLSGVHVDDVHSQIAAARALRELGARAAIVTGGHITGDRVVDVLVDDAGKVHELEGPRIGTQDVHGTGCVFSAALTGHLANGVPVVEAARKAKGLVSHAIARALKLGRGALLLDPRAP